MLREERQQVERKVIWVVQAEWMRYLSLVVEQKYGRVQDVCRQADEADRGRMRKGRTAGA